MVDLKFDEAKNCLYCGLSGEIDHHSAAGLRQSIDREAERFKPATVLLDFRRVTFMDSSGIGLVMGRYRTAQQFGGKIMVRAAAGSILKVMKLSGLQNIATFVD